MVVLALLTATVFRDNVVSFFRWATYSQQNDSFSHNAQSNSLFMGLEDNLLICTQSQIQLVSPHRNLSCAGVGGDDHPCPERLRRIRRGL